MNNVSPGRNRNSLLVAAALTAGLLGALASGACKGETVALSDPPTWSGGVSKLMENECAGCHEWATNYEQVKAKADGGLLAKQLKRGHNIKGEAREGLQRWVTDGAPQG